MVSQIGQLCKERGKRASRRPEPKEGTRRNKAAEHMLNAVYLLRNLRPWLYSIQRDGENSQEGIQK